MADFRRGIEAGATAVFAYIFVVLIFANILYRFFWGPLAQLLLTFGGSEELAQRVVQYGLSSILKWLVWEIVEGGYIFYGTATTLLQLAVWGIVFGTIFAALYNLLPGGGRVRKGLVLSASLWIVALIQIIYTTGEFPIHTSVMGYTYYGGIINVSPFTMTLFSVVSALIVGSLTGYMWDRFRGKELTEKASEKPVLLVSFILGGITWATLSAVFLWNVVDFGWVSTVNLSLWNDLLRTSVVFLGLPGWVLALVAWRKTKGGQSGLIRGVAGGILMAVTGFMLLPGLLAIAGGALSRQRNPAEHATAAIQQ